MYAELSLDHEVVKEALKKKWRSAAAVGPAQRRQLAHWIVNAKAYSQQRACRLAGLSRRMLTYQSKRQPDTEVEQALQTVARRHPGWGFWRPPRGRFVIACADKVIPAITNGFGAFIANWD